MMILSRRVPSRFCCSINSSTCLRKSRPSSTSASAIRSPKVLIGGIREQKILPESLANACDNIGGGRQVPKQALLGGRFHFEGGLAIEGVGRGDEDRFAQPVERQHTPALASLNWEGATQFEIEVVFFERQETKTAFI